MSSPVHYEHDAQDKQDLFARLYDDSHSDLRRFLSSKLRNRDDVEELEQECYLRIYRCNKFPSLENSRAFLFTIAANLLRDRARQNGRTSRHQALMGKPIDISNAEDIPSVEASPEQRVARKEELDLVMGAINGLAPKCRQALVMQRFNGMSHEQIADLLEVSKSMVEKYIAQAMIQMHKALP